MSKRRLAAGKTITQLYAIIMAITFAAGVFIILQGVRLILAEIVPAFTGFSENWCQTRVRRWTASGVSMPNAVLIWLPVSVFSAGWWAVPAGTDEACVNLPGVVPHFFTGGATAGVFGNAAAVIAAGR
ncbi:hypothetical protein KCP71_14855 [Salmonella enterica subsp. enterica]|nr:hypothetical protein KCP71_14855 [Salmonella enterica subsp. enterica]